MIGIYSGVFCTLQVFYFPQYFSLDPQKTQAETCALLFCIDKEDFILFTDIFASSIQIASVDFFSYPFLCHFFSTLVKPPAAVRWEYMHVMCDGCNELNTVGWAFVWGCWMKSVLNFPHSTKSLSQIAISYPCIIDGEMVRWSAKIPLSYTWDAFLRAFQRP